VGSMVKKSKRFEPVKEMAKHKETAAVVRMNQSAVEQQESLDQLEKLRGYRDEYLVQFKLKGQKRHVCIEAARVPNLCAKIGLCDRRANQNGSKRENQSG
jgi:Flagellar FliJ protein.